MGEIEHDGMDYGDDLADFDDPWDEEAAADDEYGLDPDLEQVMGGMIDQAIADRFGPQAAEPWAAAEASLEGHDLTMGSEEAAGMASYLQSVGVSEENFEQVFRDAAETFDAWLADPGLAEKFQELVSQHGGDIELASSELAAFAIEYAAKEHRVRSEGATYDDAIAMAELAGPPQRAERPHFSTYEQVSDHWHEFANSGPRLLP